ncbi:MAG: preprotein translocase subunit SecA [Legionellales bacterium]|nr:preprotein translocase subunit SecA [Legionellales bacterium]
MSALMKSIFGSRNQRLLKRYAHNVEKINALEAGLKTLSDDALKAKTQEFKQRLQAGATLDDLLPEAFAVVRETSVRTLNMRHFDVQLIGGMVLHDGKIAEMCTGEGKTLVATLPAYLNALSGRGVHIVTVNDYLAERDAHWMEPIYQFLGLTVGINLTLMPHDQKQLAYQADITYGTNNEFGFDYLRDNMAFTIEDRVQRDLAFAIVDEVDSILIDEARTPLIISGPAEDSSDLYKKIDRLIPHLVKQADKDAPGDYLLDEKTKQAYLSEAGHQKIEELLVAENIINEGESLYSPTNVSLMHHVNSALRAHTLFHRDVDYIVRNDEVVIIDEHTGRALPGRRWSEGLHQAVEAKERVKIQNENQTLASITFQNYFRLYDKLAGMTGTADTEAYEFQQIYHLEVVVIPTNLPIQRKDFTDQVYLTAQEKFAAVIKDIQQTLEQKRPVLVGTASIETSEYISQLLKKEKIPHEVLNAKQPEREAHIIAQAGRPGSVTIATNMAGRGTDIVLGGNFEAEVAELENPTPEKIAELKKIWQARHDAVIAAGGLHVIGSERHESRRIDNQLRGRCGRQGDPGSSRFYLSLEDNLLRIFAPDWVSRLMKSLGMPKGEPIEHRMVSRSIENAQRKVEGHNFDIRKDLLEFDDVANVQRKAVYERRQLLMSSDDLSDGISSMRRDVLSNTIHLHIPPNSLEEQWNIPELEKQLRADFGLSLPLQQWLEEDHHLTDEHLQEKIIQAAEAAYAQKEQQVGSQTMRQFEKAVMLQELDAHWKDHLAAMDHLRHSIHLHGYAQKDPKQEYKRVAFEKFSTMLGSLEYDIVNLISCVEVQAQADVDAMEEQRRKQALAQAMQFDHANIANIASANTPQNDAGEDDLAKVIPFVREEPKVGRNDPCPCGSGKKYKQCHGKIY